MSLVSGYEFITAMMDGDQVSAALYPTLPLSQYLKKGTTSASPDWTVAVNQPIIYVRAKSQLQGTRKEIVAGSEKWTYNGGTIVFNSSGISTAPANLFKKVMYDDGGVNVPALQIIGNIASPTNTDNDSIGFSGKVKVGTVETDIFPSIDIRVEETVGDPYGGYIDATEGGVIDDDTSSTICTAYLTKSGVSVTAGVSYKWYKANTTGGWDAISSDAGAPNKKTMTADDINTECVLKVDFLINNVIVYSATRQLSDETDPLIIASNPSGSRVLPFGGSITFAPKVVRRSSGAVESGYSFSYAKYNNKDASIGTSTGATITITRKEVDDNYGGIKIYISASKV